MEIKASVTINQPSAFRAVESSSNRDSRTNVWEERFKEKTGHNFNQFYSKYYPKLVWQIKQIKITDLDAEDIANQAFMRALDKIDTYNPQWHFSTWLFNIGKNMAYLYKKQNAKNVLMDFEQTAEEDWTPMHSYVQSKMTDSTEFDNEYEQNLQKKYKLTLKEISHLSEKFRYIIELCDIQGKTYNEISEITKLPLQTVKNRLFHGRTKLETALSANFKWINENN